MIYNNIFQSYIKILNLITSRLAHKSLTHFIEYNNYNRSHTMGDNSFNLIHYYKHKSSTHILIICLCIQHTHTPTTKQESCLHGHLSKRNTLYTSYKRTTNTHITAYTTIDMLPIVMGYFLNGFKTIAYQIYSVRTEICDAYY